MNGDLGDVLHDVMLELGSVAARMNELVDVVSGSAVTVPRRVVLTVAAPFDTWKTTGGEFHSVKVDNPNAFPLYVRFDGTRPTLGDADEIVPPESGRILTRPFRQITVGYDDAALAATAPLYAFVTAYARQLPPATYELSALGGGSEPVAGRYNAAPPTLASGADGELQLDTLGNLRVTLTGADTNFRVGVLSGAADGQSTGWTGIDAAAFGWLFNGAAWDRARTPNVFKLINAVPIVAGTGAVIWTPGAGKKWRIMGWKLFASVDAALLFKEAGTTFLEDITRAASPATPSPPMGNGYLAAAANDTLVLDVSVNATVYGFVFGTEE